MSEIGIGIIGCGTIAEFMLDAWAPRISGARLVAASDPSADRRKLFESRYGLSRTFADHTDLLDQAEIDAVLVLTPNHLHAAQSEDALKRGKHVLCQKPLALDVKEARSMVDTAEAAQKTLMAGFVRRFWPLALGIERLKADGRLGQIRAVRSQFSHSGIGKYYKPASQWFGDKSKVGGGPLFDLGVHHFDVLRWLVGAEVADVQAITSSSGGDLEDNAVVNFRFADGTLGQGFYSFTTAAPPGVTLERVEVFGTLGTAIAALEHPGRPVLRFVAEGEGSLGGWVDIPVSEPVPAFAVMCQHFVDALAAERPPVTSGSDGLISVAIAQAAYASAESGRRQALSNWLTPVSEAD